MNMFSRPRTATVKLQATCLSCTTKYLRSYQVSKPGTVDTSETISEITGKFINVVLEKDGEDHLDLSCEK
jgi:hypothetical protein